MMALHFQHGMILAWMRVFLFCLFTTALLHTNAYGYLYDPIGHQKSAKPKPEAQDDRDFEAVRMHGARSGNPRHSGNCYRLITTRNSETIEYVSNPLNQYTSVSTFASSAPLRLDSPTYDPDGNMTFDGVFTYTWDAENRLTSVSSNGVDIVTYAYDFMHRRIRKTTPTETRAYVYDGWNLIQETIAHSGGTSTVHYVWGLDISGTLQGAGGVGGLLAVIIDGVPYFPCYDANGNITEYVDASGNVVAHYEYSPFGETIARFGDLSDTFAFRFSTKYFDPETHSYYYGYRYYAPKLGCWLSRDPIEEDGGINLHGFAENDPVNKIDKLGLLSSEEFNDPYPNCFNDGWLRHCIQACRLNRVLMPFLGLLGSPAATIIGGWFYDPPWKNDPDSIGDRAANNQGIRNSYNIFRKCAKKCREPYDEKFKKECCPIAGKGHLKKDNPACCENK